MNQTQKNKPPTVKLFGFEVQVPQGDRRFSPGLGNGPIFCLVNTAGLYDQIIKDLFDRDDVMGRYFQLCCTEAAICRFDREAREAESKTAVQPPLSPQKHSALCRKADRAEKQAALWRQIGEKINCGE